MVDLSPLLEKFSELVGCAAELEQATITDKGVIFSLSCTGGYIGCRLEVAFGVNELKEEQCQAFAMVLIPIFGEGEVFDLTQIDSNERCEENIQDKIDWSILTILDDVPGKRYVGFRRLEVLDCTLDFSEQDHDRLAVILDTMLSEVQDIFPGLVAYHQGRKEIYGDMVLSVSPTAYMQ